MKNIKQYLGKVSITCNGTWDINRQYDRLCLVNDGFFASYISRIPVPAGIPLENRDYWQPVASLKDDVKVHSEEFEKNVLQLIANIQFKLKSARITVQNVEERDSLMWNEVGVGCEVYVIDTKQSWILDSIVCSDTPEASYKEWHLEADGKIDSEEKYELEGQFDTLTADRAICDALGNIIHDTYISRETIKNYTSTIISDFLDTWRYEIQDGTITYDMFSDALKQLLEANGTEITNLPDEEDLTVKDNQLKFKDRPYNELDFTGKGHIILRKNWMNNINLLEQSMLQEANTIYDIRYTFYLDGQTVEVPDNCVLNLMEGGELRNGTLHCNNTMIAVFDTKYLNVVLTGTYKFFSSEHGITINVIDNLESDDNASALSARQGKVLNEKITANSNELDTVNENIETINNNINNIDSDIDGINDELENCITGISNPGHSTSKQDNGLLAKSTIAFTKKNNNGSIELTISIPGVDENTPGVITPEILSIINKIITTGAGDKVLTDNGNYKDIDTFVDINNIVPEGGTVGQVLKKTASGVEWANDEVGEATTVDSSLNDSSINPVQNKVIKDALDNKANSSHTHNQSDINGLTDALTGKANVTHTHSHTDIDDWDTELAKKANSTHNHTVSQVTDIAEVAKTGSYNDLTDKPAIPSEYELPIASSSQLGGIKIGNGLNIAGDGTVSVVGGTGGDGSYTLPVASKTVLGGVKKGDTVKVSSDGTLNVDADAIVADYNKLGLVKGVVDGDAYGIYYSGVRAGIDFTDGLITLNNEWAGNTVSIWQTGRPNYYGVGFKLYSGGLFRIAHTASSNGVFSEGDFATIDSAAVGPLILLENNNSFTFKQVLSEAAVIDINICSKGRTADRPAFIRGAYSHNYDFIGFQYYDTNLKKPIWFDGTVWRDAMGTQV